MTFTTITTQLQAINPTQGLTPTGRRAITRSAIEGPNQDKSTVSCVHRRVLHTPKPEQNYPGDPRGRLSVVKHQPHQDHGNQLFPTAAGQINGI